MKDYQQIFKRIEKKYLLTGDQYEELRRRMEQELTPDRYGLSGILNIYYDTPDFRLIRASLAKPVYKEKLRLRTYGVPVNSSPAFIEIKKKYKGVVYKRRIDMSYSAALTYMRTRIAPDLDAEGRQIKREIDYFFRVYPDIAPRVALSYDRIALAGRMDPDLRVTFDSNIRFRGTHLDLRFGNGGEPLLEPGQHLMEIKLQGGMPLWLARDLSELEIYPVSFSKYGKAYERMAAGRPFVPQLSGRTGLALHA